MKRDKEKSIDMKCYNNTYKLPFSCDSSKFFDNVTIDALNLFNKTRILADILCLLKNKNKMTISIRDERMIDIIIK